MSLETRAFVATAGIRRGSETFRTTSFEGTERCVRTVARGTIRRACAGKSRGEVAQVGRATVRRVSFRVAVTRPLSPLARCRARPPAWRAAPPAGSRARRPHEGRRRGRGRRRRGGPGGPERIRPRPTRSPASSIRPPRGDRSSIRRPRPPPTCGASCGRSGSPPARQRPTPTFGTRPT
eukprot:322560-Pyramimonas_sp.AAC.1